MKIKPESIIFTNRLFNKNQPTRLSYDRTVDPDEHSKSTTEYQIHYKNIKSLNNKMISKMKN